jgi:hypothetical protein
LRQRQTGNLSSALNFVADFPMNPLIFSDVTGSKLDLLPRFSHSCNRIVLSLPCRVLKQDMFHDQKNVPVSSINNLSGRAQWLTPL